MTEVQDVGDGVGYSKKRSEDGRALKSGFCGWQADSRAISETFDPWKRKTMKSSYKKKLKIKSLPVGCCF